MPNTPNSPRLPALWGLLCSIGLLTAPLPAVGETAGTGVVTLRWAGASPIEVEQSLVRPAEVAIAPLPGVASMVSRSEPGVATVVVTLRPGADPYAFSQALVGSPAWQALPDEADSPSLSMLHSAPVALSYALEGDIDQIQLGAIHDTLVRDALRALPGVAEVRTCGVVGEQVRVRCDAARLAAYGLTPDAVWKALGGAGVRTGPGASDIETLADMTLRPAGAAGPSLVRLRDVAEISTALAQPNGLCRWGDRPAVCGWVAIAPGAPRDEVLAAVTARLAALASQLPPSVRLHAVSVPADGVERAIGFRVRVPGGGWRGEAARSDVASRLLDIAERIPSVVRTSLRFDGAGDWGLLLSYDEPPPSWSQVIRAFLREPGLSVVPDPAHHPPAFRLRVLGEDLDQLTEVADGLERELREVPGVQTLDVVGREQQPTLRFHLDRDRLARYGLVQADVARQLRAGLKGDAAWPSLPFDGRRRLRFSAGGPAGRPRDFRALEAILLRTPAGAEVPATALASFEQAVEPLRLLRKDGQRFVELRGWAAEEASLLWRMRLRVHLSHRVVLPPGVRLGWE